MSLKNIIKLTIILLIPFFFLSCKKIDNVKNKDENILLTLKDDIDNVEIFSNLSKNYNKNHFDY